MVASFFVIESVIRFIDMFSGIGGFREGLTRAGGFECVGHKQAGNGVTVNVVEAIGRRIAKMDAELRGEALAP